MRIVRPIKTVEPRNSDHVGHEHRPGFSSCHVSWKYNVSRATDPLHQRKPKITATATPQIKIVVQLLTLKNQFYSSTHPAPLQQKLAEREGFEPPLAVKPKRFSRPPR